MDSFLKYNLHISWKYYEIYCKSEYSILTMLIITENLYENIEMNEWKVKHELDIYQGLRTTLHIDTFYSLSNIYFKEVRRWSAPITIYVLHVIDLTLYNARQIFADDGKPLYRSRNIDQFFSLMYRHMNYGWKTTKSLMNGISETLYQLYVMISL